MSRKSSGKKKDNQASWYHCEICGVYITPNSRDTHEKVCPIAANAVADETGAPLEYIRGGDFYTASVECRTFTIDAMSKLSPKFVNHTIYMSEGAIRLANFYIGQQVLIKLATDAADAPGLVRSIWPVPEKFLTTIFVNEPDLQLYWQNLKGEGVRIHKLPNDYPTPAKVVRLKLEAFGKYELNEAQLKELERILKVELRHLVFATGSHIYVDFFNKPLELIVTEWQCVDIAEEAGQATLEQAMTNLTIEKKQELEYFKIIPGTFVEVQAPKQKEVAETPKFLITKADIGGLDKQLCLIEDCIGFALGFKILKKGVKLSRGLLLHGSSGCGKTMICQAMTAAVEQNTFGIKTQVITINTSELFSKFLGETEKNLNVHFEKAFANYPGATLLIVEDVHNLCPKHETNEVIKRVSVAFMNMLDSLSSKREAQRTFLLATTSNIEALNANLRRYGRLDFEVEIGAPAPCDRVQIIGCLLRNLQHSLTEQHILDVAHITHGFVGADLANLIYNASMVAFKGNEKNLTVEHMHAALTHVKPSAMREVLIENPNVHWTDIGGQDDLKLKLKQAIEWPLQHPEKFKHLGIKPPRGILMFGPPGCSKTMIAKALATESQLNFLSIKGPELFSMWVGESERAVREVFRKARQVAPSIVFFDEIDAIGGERSDGSGSGGSSVQERVLTQLLTELDGVEALQNVTIVAATNRPDMIDKALLRPGRIDRIVYVGLPDAVARLDIFRIKLKPMPLAEDVKIEELVQCTEGYSGAEIQAVCHEAALKALEESFNSKCVTRQHFLKALNLVQPRTSPDLLRLYEDYQKKS